MKWIPKNILLSNHLRVLAALDTKKQYTQRQMAAELEITERAIQRIVRDLEMAGFLEREKNGRRTKYRICKDTTLLPENDIRISDILCLLNN